jgi:hypothetical protein
MPKHERNPLTSAEVGEPVPGKDTLDGHDDIGAIQCNSPKECLWTGFHVLVQQNLPSLVQDADIHATGMQIDAAVKLVWLGVESHEVSSSLGGYLPSASIPRRYAEEGTSISIKRVQATAYSRA